jgi:hypothetical protein
VDVVVAKDGVHSELVAVHDVEDAVRRSRLSPGLLGDDCERKNLARPATLHADTARVVC